jgi:hypothetical protein
MLMATMVVLPMNRRMKMKEKLVTEIEQGMVDILDNAQMERLRKVLSYCLFNVAVAACQDESAQNTNEQSNDDMLEIFLASKRVEGCSEKSMKYYRSTIQNALATIVKGFKHITTNDLRQYLADYQKNGKAGKVTVDNIRRILSSFFRGWRTRTIFSRVPCAASTR